MLKNGENKFRVMIEVHRSVDVDIELFFYLEVILLVLVFNNHISIFSMVRISIEETFSLLPV